MALVKTTPTNIGTVSSLAASASWATSLFDVSDAVAAELECIFSFGTAPTTGNITIDIYPSQDGTNVADEPIASWTTETITTTSYRVVIPVDIVADKNILANFVNNTDQSVTIEVNAVRTTI